MIHTLAITRVIDKEVELVPRVLSPKCALKSKPIPFGLSLTAKYKY